MTIHTLAPTTLLITLLPFATVRADIAPEARALVEASAAKLAAAKTLKLTAKHELEAPLGGNGKLDKGPLHLTVKRPNLIHVLQDAGNETRELAFDGLTLCIIHPRLLHHALETVKAQSIGQLGDVIDARFGFRPPLTELLAEDMAAQLFLHVTDAKCVGRERVGWTLCHRIHFAHEGMSFDLWIGAKDNLPRRLQFTFTDIAGQPVWDLRMSKWVLDGPVDDSLFSRRPTAASSPVKMLKTR